MTWNLWWQFGPWEERQNAIRSVVLGVAPDILCIQESWGERLPSGEIRSQVVELADALGFSHTAPHEQRFYAEQRTPVARAFSNAIISRWPLSDMSVKRLPKADGTPSFRTAVSATADAPGGPLRVITSHIAHVGEDDADRLAQATRLAELADSPLATVLAGDFNSTPSSAELAALTESGLKDAWDSVNGEGWTWAETNPHAEGARHPNRRLDYILIGGLGVTRSGLAGTEPVEGVFASDHYAVWADLLPL